MRRALLALKLFHIILKYIFARIEKGDTGFMNTYLLEQIGAFDKDEAFKNQIDQTMVLLQKFRTKYPYVKKPDLIETLTGDDIFNESAGNVGDFFHWIEFRLKEIGYLSHLYSELYRNIREHLEEFKDLLHIVVDKNKSIAEKVDAPWQEISGMGGDKHLVKKIIFCFNYNTNDILPIFKTSDLEYFLEKITTDPIPDNYPRLTLGEKYQFLTSELIKNKEKMSQTKSWGLVYFSRFLYETFPPPRDIISLEKKKKKEKEEQKRQQLKEYADFVELLNELRRSNKISATERRSYQKEWDNPQNRRELLIEELKRKKNN